ncbi:MULTISPECIES: DUF433 domain-containing protein [unclassified Microcoleus]|uniref:DUF433 domain-containing protein n=1 Tax=unclassified Microcoleus TaxID=2642155 RepID=UPI0025DFC145|nr:MULTISPECIES: DUF433 domain-containing protein [unclassified Microcoleus]
MTIQELETQVLTLNPVDKAKLISILTQTLTNGSLGIKKTPGVCGGDACIGNTRIPVWSLVNYRTLGANDGQILQDFPHLSAADIVNAWAYADAYPEEIEAAIVRNEAA